MERLTGREEEILRFVARGLSCRDMAANLGIAEYTVRKHRANLCRKLDCHSAAQLIALAIRIHGATPEASLDTTAAMRRLRPREREVVRLLAQGMTSKHVARALGGISPRTVQKHRERAMRKLDVHDMSALIRVVALSSGHEKEET